MATPGASPRQPPGAGKDPAKPAAPTDGRADPGRPGEDALVAMFNQVRDELVSTLLYLLGNADDAQDAAQEAFVKCWKARHTIGEVQNLRAWIFRVGLNAAKDYQRSAWNRRARPLPEDDLLLPGREDTPGEQIEEQETLRRLREAIGQLRQEEREVFLLRENGELTYEQIAELRNAPVGTVKTQMRTALIKLRKVLNPEPPPSDEV